MNANALLRGCLVASLLVLSSCVDPDEFDQSVVKRYQEARALQGPQARESTTGLGFLEPAPPTGPRLKVTQGTDGKAQINLSLDEAIMRCLANSLDIKVVSYDPETTRQQMIEAAAAFDYILFGSVGWNAHQHAQQRHQPATAGLRDPADPGRHQADDGYRCRSPSRRP